MTKNSLSMSSLCILLAFFAVSHAFLCTEDMYQEYLTHWGRNFTQEKQSSEYTSRFSTYCQNRQYVDEINSQDLPYNLDVYWQWMDKSETERNSIVRVELPIETIASTAVPMDQIDQIRKVGATLPTSVDYRLSGDVSSIKGQGSCGCCWSFTTVGTYESFMMLKGEQEYDLSEEYILECTTLYTKNVKKLSGYESTCGGGYVDFAGELAKVNGIPLETKFPYIAANYTGSIYPTTPGICEANQTVMYAKDPSVTTFGVSKNNSNDRMKELISNGPVGALIYADTGFQSYKSGIYSGCPTSFSESYNKINHAVVIIGYDADGNYIVKNSWATTWGQNGFGVVSKDRDCGLSAYAFQYVSSAAPGGGVMFYGQTSMNSSSSSGYQMLGWVMGTMLVMLAIFS